MTLEEKQQDIIDEFAIYDDWIRESTAFEDQALALGTFGHPE